MHGVTFLRYAVVLAGALAAAPATAGVTAQEAAKLKNELTPFGAERAGNADGGIPAWTGGLTTPFAGDDPKGRRGDPFAGEKPLFSITSKTMAQYADGLTDGTKEMLRKYPDTFRVDVYKTHRTASAPQWVYDNTFANATGASLNGYEPQGAYGGIPFPIPKSGAEVIWNHQLRWRAPQAESNNTWYQLLADGRAVLVSDATTRERFPYYAKDSSLERFLKNDDPFYQIAIRNSGPPIREGQALLAHEYLDQSRLQTWVYLQGQRRVRKLPNGCCDTPTPAAAGIMTFDELYTFVGRLDRFDWKLLGKKEMFVPYNVNRLLQPKTDEEVLKSPHLDPDHMRWEKHRVWVVEATLRAGQRHQAARSRYYCDEDTWICVLGDRWDANGQLWRTLWTLTFVAPDVPGLMAGTFGSNDLLAGTGFVAHLFGSKPVQWVTKEVGSGAEYTPDAMVGDSVR